MQTQSDTRAVQPFPPLGISPRPRSYACSYMLDIPTASLDSQGVISHLANQLASGQKTLCLPVTLGMLVQANRDPLFHDVIRAYDFAFATESSLIRLSHRCGRHSPEYGTRPLSEPCTMPVLVEALGRLSAQKNGRVFLLAESSARLEALQAVIQSWYPASCLVGTSAISSAVLNTPALSIQAIEAINAVQPDILLVDLPSPLQERWLLQYRESLTATVIVPGAGALTVRQKKQPFVKFLRQIREIRDAYQIYDRTRGLQGADLL